MKKLSLLASLLLTLALLPACNRTPQPIDPASAKAVKVQLNTLQDTVQARWQEMITTDDAKLSALRQVLRALAEKPTADRTQLDQLLKSANRLKNRRYSQQSMRESALIDAYDAAQDSVLRAVYALATPPAGQPDEFIRNLTEGIQQSDDAVLGQRVRYDQAAQHFNDYLKLHQPDLAELGGKYAQLQPLALFALAQ